jgi:4-methoxybenzoate monooxygenase (O-demethylating)
MAQADVDQTRVPVLDLDPFSKDFLADPHPGHAVLRDAGAVVTLSRYGVYAMARHEQVFSSLKDWKTFCSSRGVGLSDFAKEPPWRPPSLLLEVEPPLHDRMRAVLNPLLSMTVLAQLKETWSKIAAALVDQLVERGDFDAVKDLAEVFPLKVFPDAVGLPQEGRQNLLAYGSLAFNAFGPRNDLYEDALAGAAPVTAWIQANCKRSALAVGGFGQGVFAAVDRGEVTEEEGERLVRSFLSAGVDTTINGLAAMLLALASNPDQWRVLKADRSLVRPTFEEVLRWASPVQTFFRTTTRPVEIAGVAIPEGCKVLLFLGAANRDPRKWDSPDSFDVRRKVMGHVALGVGVHACLGQMVARLEAEVILTALLDRVETLEATGTMTPRLNNTLRSYASVPVRARAS